MIIVNIKNTEPRRLYYDSESNSYVYQWNKWVRYYLEAGSKSKENSMSTQNNSIQNKTKRFQLQYKEW